MEQKRLIIAIGISFGIFILWSLFFAPTPPKPSSDRAGDSVEIESGTNLPPVASPSMPQPAPPPAAQETEQPARQIVVQTPLYRMTLSEKGAAVTSMVLKEYREALSEDSPSKELIPASLTDGTVLTQLSGLGAGTELAVFTADREGDRIDVGSEKADLRFRYRTETGIVIEKTYTFDPGSYLVDLKVTVYNQGQFDYQGKLGVGLNNAAGEKASRLGFEGPCGLVNNSLEQVTVKDIKKKNQIAGEIQWVAIEGRYFMSSIISREPVKGTMVLAHDGNTLKNQFVIETNSIAPQQSQSFDYILFLGPKSWSLLKTYGFSIDRAINFGWFDILAKPCLWFMNFIYRVIPNYGIAIIILTLVTRAMFWPLATKSYKSMGQMRRVQPLMQEIRERYKDDKARMNQEMMTLYRTYKINPMSGCLPMLIQLPVFFALYRMLYSAIELRHAPFFGWINDLSAPDRLFHFDFSIPFMEPPYGIPVLTIVMGASMLLQQKMSPAPGDPAQAKMMMLMPIVFTFIFINFSSGLVLYWFVSNIFSIAQQYYTQKQTR